MTLNEIEKLDNFDLLELYASLVRVEYYDPFETPVFAKDLWNQGIDQHVLAQLIRVRMNHATN